MSDLTAYLKPQLDRLSSRQRHFYDLTIREGGANPFQAARQLRADMERSDFDLELRHPASLALAELNARASNRPAEPTDPEAAAVEDIRQQISKAEEVGDSEKAKALRNTLERVQAKREGDAKRVEEVQQAHAKHWEQEQARRTKEFNEQFERLRQARISELSLDGRMKPEQAERLFDQLHRAPLQQSLRRSMGLK